MDLFVFLPNLPIRNDQTRCFLKTPKSSYGLVESVFDKPTVRFFWKSEKLPLGPKKNLKKTSPNKNVFLQNVYLNRKNAVLTIANPAEKFLLELWKFFTRKAKRNYFYWFLKAKKLLWTKKQFWKPYQKHFAQSPNKFGLISGKKCFFSKVCISSIDPLDRCNAVSKILAKSFLSKADSFGCGIIFFGKFRFAL